jgi:hypothetical protein
MAYGMINLNAVQAMNVDSLNRSAVCADIVENGNLVILASMSATVGESEVWTATKPATATLSGGWVVADPEVVVTYSGSSAYKGLDPDIRNFRIPAAQIFRAIKLSIGDIVELSADALGTGAGAESAWAVATDATYELTWASAAVSGVSLKYLKTTYVSLATGAIGETQRVAMYKFQVTAV